MAMSNRERIGAMFEALSPALDTFLTETIDGHIAGMCWFDLVRVRDERKGIMGKKYDADDVQVQLRFITEGITNQIKNGWRPVTDVIGRVGESFCSELRKTRDDWAHLKSFTDDDAYRALDTAERVCNLIARPEAAMKIQRLRVDLRRVTSAKDDRRTLQTVAQAMPTATGLLPWREVLRPHDDVATGNFQASQFAADLYKVATQASETSAEYADPVEYFARTYLTDGLRDLMGRAIHRLAGDDNASPVINLQTNFGGGKTHSMLALWHLAAGLKLGVFPQETQELLQAEGFESVPDAVRRVAIVGNHFSSAGETKPDGTHVNTVWGEIAWQLGGREAYAIVAESDAKSVAPGQALHALLKAYAPAVILIDEWVAYARQLHGRDDLAAGTFDTQFTFAQSLTEAVKGTSGVLLAISIPASERDGDSEPIPGNAEEVGGTNGLEALHRLQNVVRRVADQWRPASSDEAYHIVRQRLFVPPDAKALASINATAKTFVEFYRKHADEFPREARDNDYVNRIKSTYPIHPELFDRLYEDWSTLERFQRTRGVLRLINTVIYTLWSGQDASPLIMPGSIPLHSAKVNAELTQYLQDSWKSIIDADVDGVSSEPAKIDAAKPLFGQRSTCSRLARTVFFGAAPTIGTAHKGIEEARVFLGTAIPGDVPGNFRSALNQLSDRATYFYSANGKYWYDLQANITRRAKDQAERLKSEDVWADVTRRLQAQARTTGAFAGVHVSPEANADVPDQPETRLVLLPPSVTHKNKQMGSLALAWARDATERRGTANRAYRNALVFLAPDVDRMAELDHAVREHLGWKHVLDNANELDLTPSQANQARDRSRGADETATARLAGTYVWLIVPTEEPGHPFDLDVRKVEGQNPSLAERVTRRLGTDGDLATRQAANLVRMQLNRTPALWQDSHVTVEKLWDAYARYPYLPRLRDERVLMEGLLDQPLLWQDEGFALATAYDTERGRYDGLVLPGERAFDAFFVTGSTLIVKPEPAQRQRAAELVAVPPTGPTLLDPTPEPDPKPGATPQPPSSPDRGPSRYYGSVELRHHAYAHDFAKVVDSVLRHLIESDGTKATIRLEVEATRREGFSESVVRTVSENAATLKFTDSGFEND